MLLFDTECFWAPIKWEVNTWGYIYFARRFISDSWKLNEPWAFGNAEWPVFLVYLNSTFRNILLYVSGMKTSSEGPDSKYSRI